MKTFPKKLFILLIVLTIVFLNIASTAVRGVFYFLSGPLEKVFWQAGQRLSGSFSDLWQAGWLAEENERLVKESLEKEKELVDCRWLAKENETLRKALEVNLASQFDLLLAQVIAKPIDQDILLINLGKGQGVEEGMPVITEEKVLVGVVSEVFLKGAQVSLISAQGVVLDIEIEDDALGLAEGKGGMEIVFDKVAKEKTIQKGYVAITANLSGKFPRGLLIGTVKEVEKVAAEPFQKGRLEPYFKEQPLDQLFLISDF